jgi:arylformamidase
MHVIDLTLPLDHDTPVYAEPDGYRDPAFLAEPWATYAEQGYSVHRVEMGSHTGTHLDAPAHFHPAERTVDQIPASALVGRALVIDVRSFARVTVQALRPYSARILEGALPLFLAPESGVCIERGAVAAVATWRPVLVLYAGSFEDEGERYHHSRVWLGAGIPLVTDLHPPAAKQVRDGALLIVAPLRLVGLDGSPCRVFALQCEFRPNP